MSRYITVREAFPAPEWAQARKRLRRNPIYSVEPMEGGMCRVTWRKYRGRWRADRRAFERYAHIHATQMSQLVDRAIKRIFMVPMIKSLTADSSLRKIFKRWTSRSTRQTSGRYVEQAHFWTVKR